MIIQPTWVCSFPCSEQKIVSWPLRKRLVLQKGPLLLLSSFSYSCALLAFTVTKLLVVSRVCFLSSSPMTDFPTWLCLMLCFQKWPLQKSEVCFSVAESPFLCAGWKGLGALCFVRAQGCVNQPHPNPRLWHRSALYALYVLKSAESPSPWSSFLEICIFFILIFCL